MRVFEIEVLRSISGRATLTGLVAGLALGLPGCGTVTASKTSAHVESKSTSPSSGAIAAVASDRKADCCESTTATDPPASAGDSLGLAPIKIPAMRVIDQNGRSVDLARDLVGSRVAAIQFVFTRCVTTCPILGNQFADVRRRLGNRMTKDFALISISVDPEYDNPERLNDWGRRYGIGPGWSLVTGPKPEMDRLLKVLAAFSADRQNHQSQVLVIDGATGKGLRTSGLAKAGDMVGVMERVRAARPRSESPELTVAGRSTENEPAEHYFTNTPLIDQSGASLQFYNDVLRGKVVVINVFFSQCNGSCVAMGNTLAKLQDRLGERLDRDVRLISITVDSPHDTPEVLATYAQRYGARKGWYFLSGQKTNVDTLLKKLGQYVEFRESHGALFLAGNMQTGLWKKVFGLADSQQVIDQIDSVINDKAG
jgi:protein SCO1